MCTVATVDAGEAVLQGAAETPQAALLSLTMSSAQQAFQVLLSIGAGTGLLYIARWFWWRVSAWCEIVAMVLSLITSLAVPYFMPGADFATTTIVQVSITTVAWLITAFVGPTTDRATLIAFVQKVKPVGRGGPSCARQPASPTQTWRRKIALGRRSWGGLPGAW